MRTDVKGEVCPALSFRVHGLTLISVVGAIADRTLRASKTIDALRANFHDRLAVLGRAGTPGLDHRAILTTLRSASKREA